jgi:hydroxymethylpyrimidine pyrophosphatase-like HAD family hydrolase
MCDIDGVITRGEGQPVDLDVIARLAAMNRRSAADASVPAITLCTGRQAPYVELMAQLTETFMPCIFEHGAGLFFPREFRYEFIVLPGYSARLAALRALLDRELLAPGRAFVQPGKEATMTLYPLSASLDEVFDTAERLAPEGWTVARNVLGVELRPEGIDKALGLRHISELLAVPVSETAGVGDSDPDLGFLSLCGFSAAPANATPAVKEAVDYVSEATYGEGLLDILSRLTSR